jgi:hypothetical protein
MNANDLKKFIEESVFDEAKKSIIAESKNKEYYSITCDGKPLATFDSKKEAEIALPKLKDKHKGKKLIIEKAPYKSYSDMIEDFDKMSEELENENNMENKKNMNEGISDESKQKLSDACQKLGCRKVAMKLVDKFLLNTLGISSSDLPDSVVYADGLDEIEDLLEQEDWDTAISVAKDTAQNMLEDEGMMDLDEDSEDYDEDEEIMSDEPELDKLLKDKDSVELDVTGDEEIGRDYLDDDNVDIFSSDENEDELDESIKKHVHEMFDDDEEIGASEDDIIMSSPELARLITGKESKAKKDFAKDLQSDPDYVEHKKRAKFTTGYSKETDSDYGADTFGAANVSADDPFLKSKLKEDDLDETVKGMCSECGKMLTEEGTMCSECLSMKENDKEMCAECGTVKESHTPKKLKLKESQLKRILKNLINEAMKGQPGTPGIVGKTVAQRSSKESGVQAKAHLKDVEKKMKDYLSFDGNTNPEFPHQNGGDRMAIHPSKEQADEIAKNKAGLQNLDYDMEPSENFKKRLEAAIKGDTKMGNSAVTGDNSIKTSNGAKANDAKEKSGNTIPTKTDEFLTKQMKDRQEDKDERELYNRAAVPTKTVSESVDKELNAIKRLSGYNKRTQ